MTTNYLEVALNNHTDGYQADLNHLMRIIGSEQLAIRDKLIQDGFWFVDIPRTSSTAIRLKLSSLFGYPHGKKFIPGNNEPVEGVESFLIPQHMPAFIMTDIVGADVWDQLRTFTIVRHPMSWAVSLWQFTIKYGNLHFTAGDFMNFLQQLEKKLQGDKEDRPVFPTSYCQTDYIRNIDDEDDIIKDVLKYEDREQIDTYLAQAFGPDFLIAEKFAITDAESYMPSEQEKQQVHRILARDFELLGY